MAYRFYIRLSDGQLVDGPNGNSVGTSFNPIVIPRADFDVEFQFLDTADDGSQPGLRLASGADIQFFQHAITDGKIQFEGDAIIAIDATTITRPAADTGFYTARLIADTAQAQALLKTPDGDPTNDLDSYPLAGVFTWKLTSAPPGDSANNSQRIYVTLANTFITTGGIDPASGSATLRNFVGVITGITGGGATNLDGLATIGKGFNSIQFIDATSGYRVYQLRAGTDATSAPAIVRAADYATSTNEFVWYSQN